MSRTGEQHLNSGRCRLTQIFGENPCGYQEESKWSSGSSLSHAPGFKHIGPEVSSQVSFLLTYPGSLLICWFLMDHQTGKMQGLVLIKDQYGYWIELFDYSHLFTNLVYNVFTPVFHLIIPCLNMCFHYYKNMGFLLVVYITNEMTIKFSPFVWNDWSNSIKICICMF